MLVSVVEEKIRRLPENYVPLVNSYIDQLLEKAEAASSNEGQNGRLSPEWFDEYRGMVSGEIDIEKRKAEYFGEKYGRLY